MDKKIEDYLHLYLGCEMSHVDSPSSHKLIGIVENHCYLKYPNTNNPYRFKLGDTSIKPILRPLTSLTLEEDQVIFPANNRGHKIDMHWFPEGFAWLLKNQFDLFGLIESNLAISKVEVSNPLKTQDEK